MGGAFKNAWVITQRSSKASKGPQLVDLRGSVTSNYDHGMKRGFALVLSILTWGCNSPTSDGFEIANGEFDNLIISRKVQSLTHISQYDLIQIELKPKARANFQKQIEKLKAEGSIGNDDEFRLYLKIADIDFIENRIRETEEKYSLSTIPIRRE